MYIDLEYSLFSHRKMPYVARGPRSVTRYVETAVGLLRAAVRASADRRGRGPSMVFPVILKLDSEATNLDLAIERKALEPEKGRHFPDRVDEFPTRKARRVVFARPPLSNRDRSKAKGVVDRDRKGPFASIVDVARR